MKSLSKAQKIAAWSALGTYIERMEGRLEFVIRQAKVENGWFTVENTKAALHAIRKEYLDAEKLSAWLDQYPTTPTGHSRRIGLILAGNIPLVGFQDVFNVMIAGHHAVIKLSDKDKYLIPHLLKVLTEIEPAYAAAYSVVSQLKDYEAVIATGSNNSARYFEAYFRDVPNIIRRNRNSVGILHGSESIADFEALGEDIFQYFGLGCRNVSKIYVPEGYHFDPFLEALHERFKPLANHTKYRNNFDYNLAFYMLNRTPYYNNGVLILVENPAIASRLALLHYETYTDLDAVRSSLSAKADEVQVVVSQKEIALPVPVRPLGGAQKPTLNDYADGIDTMTFLLDLK